MLSFLLILALVPQALQWKQIKEFSGEIPDYPGLTVQVSAAEIARGDDLVKLTMRVDFPQGAPYDVFRDNMPSGFDVSSITRLQGRLELNCKTLIVKPLKGEAEVIQFNGKRHKTKEPPFAIPAGHVFAQYFCEQGEAPTKAPELKKP